MASRTIITPGEPQEETLPVVEETPSYLIKDNFLGEFETEDDKAKARRNLGVYSTKQTYDASKIEKRIAEEITERFNDYFSEYITSDNPLITLEAAQNIVSNALKDYVLKTQQNSFIQPAKDFTISKLNEHEAQDNPHGFQDWVKDLLKTKSYVTSRDIYSKSKLYTRDEISTLLKGYLKRGDLVLENLATREYADNVLYQHVIKADPHGYAKLLNDKLSSYARTTRVYDKEHTYSRDQIDSIIQTLVQDAVEREVETTLATTVTNNVTSQIKKEKYIKQDGSVPFDNPQKGVEAVDSNDLVVLSQLEQLKLDVKQEIDAKPEPIWVTSGPVEATVGMVKEGDTLASQVSFQEAMDAIFYGKRVHLTTPELAPIGESFEITLCIQGSLATVEYAEIYQNGEFLVLVTREQLQESGCVTLNSRPIDSDTEITAKVFYTNGSIHELTSTTKVSLPVFVGIIPEFRAGSTISYEMLLNFANSDKVNNKFYDKGQNMQELSHSFNFDLEDLQRIIVALPAHYSDLVEMSNSTQQFTIHAFDTINLVPYILPGQDKEVYYKMYIFKNPLYSLNSTINFKFQ